MVEIEEKLRNLLGDNLVSGNDPFKYYGTSKVFTLTNSNVDESTIKVYKNQSPTEWDSDNYSIINGKIIVSEVTGEELIPGEELEITYNYYEKYSHAELEGYIKSALIYLSVEQYKDFDLVTGDELDPEPTLAEENLIALVALILVKGSIRSYRTPEITITFGENLSIEDKIKKAINQCAKSFGTLDYVNLSEEIPTGEDGINWY